MSTVGNGSGSWVNQLPPVERFKVGAAKGVGDGVVSLAEFVGDVAVGGWNLARGGLSGAYALATQPEARESFVQAAEENWKAAKEAGSFIAESPGALADAARQRAADAAAWVEAAPNRAKEAYDQARAEALANGVTDEEFHGRLFGRGAFEVGTLFGGAGAAKAAVSSAKVAKAASAADKAADGLRAAKAANAGRGAVLAECGADDLANFMVRGKNGVVLKAERIREGTNGKIAVIGRSMGDSQKGYSGVRDYTEALRKAGKEVEIFDGNLIPDTARSQFDILTNGGRIKLSNEEVLRTNMFAQNEAWAKKLVDEGYTVIDLGDFSNQGFSPFYSLEKQTIFGK